MPQGVVDIKGFEIELRAEVLQGERMGGELSATIGYFIIFAQCVVYFLAIVQSGELFLNPFLSFRYFDLIVYQNGIGSSSISSCPSGFLIVFFGTDRNVHMDHCSYISFVHTHSKSIGSYHDALCSFHP